MKINKHGQWEFYGGKNPTPIELGFSGNLASHARTLRDTYTIQRGRAAVLKSAHFYAGVITAPAPNGLRTIDIVITPSGREPINVARVINDGSMTFSPIHASSDLEIPLRGNDIIEIFTTDLGTGGLIFYNILTALIEFDY